MTFYSIPGTNAAGHRERPKRVFTAADHPGAKEFLASRKETSHDASGFTAGDEVYFNGEPARVIREERDQHSGEVHTMIQVSRRGDAGVYKVQWQPDKARSMVIRNARRTDDYE